MPDRADLYYARVVRDEKNTERHLGQKMDSKYVKTAETHTQNARPAVSALTFGCYMLPAGCYRTVRHIRRCLLARTKQQENAATRVTHPIFHIETNNEIYIQKFTVEYLIF
eukprot:GEMP01064912.1.p1 GENE.GEMP01064912.1~~GEMP01064912.1.p1  ORF type:complete len:111 (-),score=4.06 GEMP01064912.1:833-1165(-)